MTAIRYRRSLFTKYTFCKNSPPSFNFNSIPYINLRYYPDKRKVKNSNSITLERSNLALHDSFAVIEPCRGCESACRTRRGLAASGWVRYRCRACGSAYLRVEGASLRNPTLSYCAPNYVRQAFDFLCLMPL